MAKIGLFYGISQELSQLRIASLRCVDDQLYIDQLLEELMPVEEHSEGEESFFDDFDFGSPTPTSEAPAEFESADEDTSDEVTEATMTAQQTLRNLIDSLSMQDALLSMNLDVFNVEYKTIRVSKKTGKRKMQEQVRRAFAGKGLPQRAFTWFEHDDESIIGVKNSGRLELLERFIDASQVTPRKFLKYRRMQTNEIALINALRYHYTLGDDEISAIFYIGEEYSRVILMQGTTFVNALPIINEGAESENVVVRVHSRFLLERQQSALPHLDRIFLAGSKLNRAKLEYLQENESDVKVEYLLPLAFMHNDLDFTEEELASYIVPISLATEVAKQKHPALIHADFLPKFILEQQNVLSISVPGFMVLIILLMVSYLFLESTFTLLSANSSANLEIEQIGNQIEINNQVIDSLSSITRQIEKLEADMGFYRKYIGDRNQWHYIVEMLGESFRDNPLTWGTNIIKEDGRIRLQGSTTSRRSIVDFSNLFPRSEIKKIEKREIEDYTVWDYEILFDMPDPFMSQRADEQLMNSAHKKVTPFVTIADSPSGNLYIVKNGDNPSSIAQQLGIDVERLEQINRLKSRLVDGKRILLVYPGQKLRY